MSKSLGLGVPAVCANNQVSSASTVGAHAFCERHACQCQAGPPVMLLENMAYRN
jgi:hypothetical protein